MVALAILMHVPRTPHWSYKVFNPIWIKFPNPDTRSGCESKLDSHFEVRESDYCNTGGDSCFVLGIIVALSIAPES